MGAYVGLADLLARWIYTPQGLRKVRRRVDFPSPAFTINRGRTKVWHMADITAFENAHPEVTSYDAKRRKVIGFALALTKKRSDRAA